MLSWFPPWPPSIPANPDISMVQHVYAFPLFQGPSRRGRPRRYLSVFYVCLVHPVGLEPTRPTAPDPLTATAFTANFIPYPHIS